MNKTAMRLFTGLFVVGLSGAGTGCGDEEENPCLEFHRVRYEAIGDGCENQANCCYCDCFEYNQSSLPNCVCSQFNFAILLEEDPPCEGVEREQAETCLADTAQCAEKERTAVVGHCF